MRPSTLERRELHGDEVVDDLLALVERISPTGGGRRQRGSQSLLTGLSEMVRALDDEAPGDRSSGNVAITAC